MSEKGTRFANRRTVVKAVAGLGAVGVAGQPALADSRGDALLGPYADVDEEHRYSLDEYKRVLKSEDNGAVRRVRGDVRTEDVYVGDTRTVSVSAMDERLTSGPTADETWKKCFDTPWYLPGGCVEATVEVTDAGVEVELIVAGYPIVDTVIPKGGEVSYDFDVPVLDISGSFSASAELTDGGCTVEASASFELDVYGNQFGPYSKSTSVGIC